ncbi:hypothetical protein NDU88_006060 [Pleurodeles waltl]|uniref:Uncharacterized protein n=1 Tax=Pleurodeles waltl TaxID=8319 RepID=A0AAV7SNP8_PLEWA|nr:hypothetical protein NDU88_006060 [Pleurodeles waltl]
MAASVAIRRRAWLSPTNFSAPLRDALLDVPFDGKSLFGAHADSALRRFRDSHGGELVYRPLLDQLAYSIASLL